MIYTIEELRHKVLDKAEEVYGIFKDFFGEEYVDLQTNDLSFQDEFCIPDGVAVENLSTTDITDEQIEAVRATFQLNPLSIIVWWPEVTVTNEHNKSINIWDLFARIPIDTGGTIPYEYSGFTLKRATYNMVQLASKYCHSHVPRVSPTIEGLSAWKSPCLGSGPIRNTIISLKTEYNDAMWMLFCQELSMYVTVESLRGVPYIRLEEVGSYIANPQYNDYRFMGINNMNIVNLPKPGGFDYGEYTEWLRRFTQYYLNHNHLSIGYGENGFEINMTFFNFIIDISNACIRYLNLTSNSSEISDFFNSNVLLHAFVSGNTISTQMTRSPIRTNEIDGMDIVCFKGSMKTLRILGNSSGTEETTNLLDCKVAQFILRNILKVINYRYKNEHANRGQEGTAQTYQRILYL